MKRFNTFSGCKVLVTGAFGLLGSWLVEELLKQNASVVCLERDVNGNSLFSLKNLKSQVVSVQGDLTHYDSLLRILNEYDIHTVFHLGAQTLVGKAYRSPLSTFSSNIQGTWNLLEACRLSPWVKRIVVASSDKAYGKQNDLPYIEDMPLHGRHPYDVSKSCTDLIAQTYFHTYNLPVVITRCGNIFGGGDFHFSRIVPGTIQSLFYDKNPIIRSDGTFIRDYVYVEDIVYSYLLLAEEMEKDFSLWGSAFNISEEYPLSVLEVVQHISVGMKKSLKPIIKNEAQSEIPAQYLSCKKMREKFLWKLPYGFSNGLQKTIIWYQKYFSGDVQPIRNITIKNGFCLNNEA